VFPGPQFAHIQGEMCYPTSRDRVFSQRRRRDERGVDRHPSRGHLWLRCGVDSAAGARWEPAITRRGSAGGPLRRAHGSRAGRGLRRHRLPFDRTFAAFPRWESGCGARLTGGGRPLGRTGAVRSEPRRAAGYGSGRSGQFDPRARLGRGRRILCAPSVNHEHERAESVLDCSPSGSAGCAVPGRGAAEFVASPASAERRSPGGSGSRFTGTARGRRRRLGSRTRFAVRAGSRPRRRPVLPCSRRAQPLRAQHVGPARFWKASDLGS